MTREKLCPDCGSPWRPVRRGECAYCGSDRGPDPDTPGTTNRPTETPRPNRPDHEFDTPRSHDAD